MRVSDYDYHTIQPCQQSVSNAIASLSLYGLMAVCWITFQPSLLWMPKWTRHSNHSFTLPKPLFSILQFLSLATSYCCLYANEINTIWGKSFKVSNQNFQYCSQSYPPSNGYYHRVPISRLCLAKEIAVFPWILRRKEGFCWGWPLGLGGSYKDDMAHGKYIYHSWPHGLRILSESRYINCLRLDLQLYIFQENNIWFVSYTELISEGCNET